MADSTVVDFSKMKVIELRKELKSRGLATEGDKSKLVSRLHSAVSQEDHGEYNLDSDEIDSDGVLEDEEEDKNQQEISLDVTAANDTLNEEALLEQNSSKPKEPEKPPKTLKRKSTTSESIGNKAEDKDKKEPAAKKIVLNRAASIPSTPVTKLETSEQKTEAPKVELSENKIKITAPGTEEPKSPPASKLEERAKRFGLPVTDKEKKEARKIRFGGAADPIVTRTPTDVLEKMKKRAERFGQNVSKVMISLENQEKLAKRQEKFQASK